MKNWLRWILSGLLISTAGIGFAQENPTVTIYNSNLGLVQEQRTLDLSKGRQEATISDVAEQIQAATVHIKPLGKNAFTLFEQNFQYDLVNSSKVFDKYIGENITLNTKSSEQVQGKLLSRDGSILMLQNQDGSLRLIHANQILEYNLPELPQGLILRPTLQWIVNADRAGEYPIELSYLTQGMSWEAEYILQMQEKDESGTLASWITLKNQSGATFKDAKVKLVAGDIHRASQRRGGSQPMLMAEYAKAAPSVSTRGVFEYHLYEINFPTTLYQNAIKQVALRDPTKISYKREYTFEHSERQSVKQDNVDVQIVFDNSKENNLGFALPGGVFRMMQVDKDGSEILVGEDNIDHTPKDEEVRLTAGKAFDVIGDRTVTNYTRRSDNYEQFTVKIDLRNHKSKQIEVNVLEHYYGDWEIRKESQQSTAVDATTLKYILTIPADGESTVQYTIERRR